MKRVLNWAEWVAMEQRDEWKMGSEERGVVAGGGEQIDIC